MFWLGEGSTVTNTHTHTLSLFCDQRSSQKLRAQSRYLIATPRIRLQLSSKWT